jgi:PAS domain S-box-containing protein
VGQPILAAAGFQPALADCEDSRTARKSRLKGGCGQDCPPTWRDHGNEMTGAAAPTAARDRALGRPPAWLVGAFAVVTVALLLGGYAFYRAQDRAQRDDARQALEAVSLSKVHEISRWREHILDSAGVLSLDSRLAGWIRQYLSAPNAFDRKILQLRMQPWMASGTFADLALADARGNVVLSVSGEAGPLHQEEAAALRQALSLRRPILTDLHREPGGSPHISAVAPVFSEAGGSPGALVLRCDAAHGLYPLIIAWPTASRTAETLLVRREGDAMLFLNELRHRSHTALELRIPMTRIDVPAVLAGNGTTGFTQGVDYRGVPVFADIRAIPGTPWFAITKIDVAEAMAPWRVGAVQLAGLLGGLLAAVGTLFFALWQLRAKVQSQLLMEAATGRATTAATLAAIVEGSQDAIVATDNDGIVTAWNPAAEHMHGYSAAEMAGQTLARLIPPGTSAVENGVLALIRGGGCMRPYETLRLTKDGRLLNVSLSISPIRDASGRVVGSSSIGRDITEQKRVRRDLDRLHWMLSPASEGPSVELLAQAPVCQHAARNTVRLILDAAGGPLLAEIAATFHVLMGTCFAMHEANGDLAYNEHVSDWSRFLDATAFRHCACAGDCQPQACDRWLSHGSVEKNAALETMACGEPVDIEGFDGIRLYSVPICGGGEVVGSMSMGYGDPPRDATQLARLAERYGVEAAELERHAAAYETRPPFIVELAKERLAGSARLLGEIVQRSRGEALLRETRDELARSNRELERFAHIASHDLQEPLRMVASYTQLLAHRYHDQLDQDAHTFINYAVDGATRMKQLIEDLLAYSRVTAKGLPAAVVDTQNAFSLALRNLGAAIGESHAEVTGGDLPEVLADGSQMVQLFQNLVANAIKFHTPGVPPRVRIEARQAPDHPHQWLFRVADNGIGIDPKFFDRVFVIFQRLHTRHEYPGTGIGLALCQRIVERHGGRIWIESEPGKGTAFLFTLREVNPEKGES